MHLNAAELARLAGQPLYPYRREARRRLPMSALRTALPQTRAQPATSASAFPLALPPVVISTLIHVIPVVVFPVLFITVPVDILNAMPSDPLGQPVLLDTGPWPTVIRRVVPTTIAVQVIPVIVADYIVRAANRD